MRLVILLAIVAALLVSAALLVLSPASFLGGAPLQDPAGANADLGWLLHAHH